MAHGTVAFFAPSSGITVDDSWEFQDGGAVQNQRERASELGSDGDEITSAMHGGKATTSFIFVHKGTGTNLVFPKVGLVTGGWHIDSISVRWSRDQIAPKMTVSCHKHTAGATHAADGCRTYTPSLASIAKQAFGCPSAFTGGTGKNAFSIASGAVVDLRDATYEVSVKHIDEPNATGGNLAGDNYDAVETLSVNLTGEATADDYTSDWDRTDDACTPSNTGATASSFTFEHHLAHDTKST